MLAGPSTKFNVPVTPSASRKLKLRRRNLKPRAGSSVSELELEGFAPSPCRSASTRAALPLAAAVQCQCQWNRAALRLEENAAGRSLSVGGDFDAQNTERLWLHGRRIRRVQGAVLHAPRRWQGWQVRRWRGGLRGGLVFVPSSCSRVAFNKLLCRHPPSDVYNQRHPKWYPKFRIRNQNVKKRKLNRFPVATK